MWPGWGLAAEARLPRLWIVRPLPNSATTDLAFGRDDLGLLHLAYVKSLLRGIRMEVTSRRKISVPRFASLIVG